ncbi:unnamed protein product, partial [Prunus brigantina]
RRFRLYPPIVHQPCIWHALPILRPKGHLWDILETPAGIFAGTYVNLGRHSHDSHIETNAHGRYHTGALDLICYSISLVQIWYCLPKKNVPTEGTFDP